MSPRVKLASDDNDCWVSDNDSPALDAMSDAMMDVDGVSFSIVSITFWFGGFAKSSSDTNLRLYDNADDDVTDEYGPVRMEGGSFKDDNDDDDLDDGTKASASCQVEVNATTTMSSRSYKWWWFLIMLIYSEVQY